MSIRKTLLLAFLLVGLTPAMVLALLAFDRTSRVLQAEIEQGLAAQADAVAADIDRLMFERLQNAATWARLEVMQDLRVGDVDKRASAFLQRLAAGYDGLYHELRALDAAGRVLAGSRPGAIGNLATPAAAWREARLGEARIALDEPRPGVGVGEPVLLTLRTAVASAFDDQALGELQLRVDWTQLDHRLDQAAVEGRELALLDDRGRVLAGSRMLLARLPRLAPADARADTLQGLAQLQGSAAVRALGWQVRVQVPRAQALAPVRTLGWVFAALLALVAAATLLASGAVAQAIARPVVALTAFSRSHRSGQPLPPVPVAPRGEIGELQQAFVQMVAEIERSQQQLARASALAAVGEMSAVIAHEVRTPLGIVLSSAQVLQREAALSDEGRELVGFIESETARLGRLVSALLDSTRPRPPRPAPTDIGALLRHAVGLLTAQADTLGVALAARCGDAPLVFDCDAEQMTQVLLNLILNGLQILPRGGRVDVGARLDGSTLVIEIADDGPGIEPEARARLFDAFYFRREGGIGLGLAVVQTIVQAHGGAVEATDSAWGGALFRIRLPRREGTEPVKT